jgi:hypothetical protein
MTQPFSMATNGKAACAVELVDGRALQSCVTSSAKLSEGVTDRADTLDPPREGEVDMVCSFQWQVRPFTHPLTELGGGFRLSAVTIYRHEPVTNTTKLLPL